jgi:ribosomal protein L29
VSYAKGTLPVTERLYEKELATHDFMLPPITKEEMDDVIMAFKKVYELSTIVAKMRVSEESNVKKGSNLRDEIAKILTIIREKELLDQTVSK